MLKWILIESHPRPKEKLYLGAEDVPGILPTVWEWVAENSSQVR